MWAGMMAHNNSCGVGRTQDRASHDIEHELSATYDCAHGAGLAVVIPAWMTYNMKHAHTACYGDGRTGTVGGFVKLNEKDVAGIYRLML